MRTKKRVFVNMAKMQSISFVFPKVCIKIIFLILFVIPKYEEPNRLARTVSCEDTGHGKRINKKRYIIIV